MTVVKVVEDIAFGAHWPCQSIGRGLCAKVQTGGSPRASREPLVASADMPSVGPEKDRHFSQCVFSNYLHIHKIVSLPRAPQPIEPLVRGFDALLLSCTLD